MLFNILHIQCVCFSHWWIKGVFTNRAAYCKNTPGFPSEPEVTELTVTHRRWLAARCKTVEIQIVSGTLGKREKVKCLVKSLFYSDCLQALMQSEWWEHVGSFNDWPFNNSSTMIKAFLNISVLVWYMFFYSECPALLWFLIVSVVFAFSFDLVISQTHSRVSCSLSSPPCLWPLGSSEGYATFVLIKRNSDKRE